MGVEGSLMNCSEFTELAPLYFSGELDARHAAELSEHLKSCRNCATEFDEQALLDTRLRTAVMADEADSSAIEARVLAQIAAPVDAARTSDLASARSPSFSQLSDTFRGHALCRCRWRR